MREKKHAGPDEMECVRSLYSRAVCLCVIKVPRPSLNVIIFLQVKRLLSYLLFIYGIVRFFFFVSFSVYMCVSTPPLWLAASPTSLLPKKRKRNAWNDAYTFAYWNGAIGVGKYLAHSRLYEWCERNVRESEQANWCLLRLLCFCLRFKHTQKNISIFLYLIN